MKYVPNVVSRAVHMTAFKTQKNSPQILFVAGVAGVIGTTVLACRATLQVEGVLTEAEKQRADAGRALDTQESYDQEDFINETKTIGVQTTFKIAKLYAPSLALGVLSVAALTKSHNILTKRNAALTAAYATLERAYESYRKNVIAEFGEEKDRELRFGVVDETIEIEGKDGKKKNEVVQRAADEHLYSKWFREGNKNFTHIGEQNVYFLQGAQNHCNDRLTAQGFLLLNDVYEYLGFDRTTEGCVIGWRKNGNGDGYVDFGIFDYEDSGRLRSFMMGVDKSIMLNFNCDPGTVYDQVNDINAEKIK